MSSCLYGLPVSTLSRTASSPGDLSGRSLLSRRPFVSGGSAAGPVVRLKERDFEGPELIGDSGIGQSWAMVTGHRYSRIRWIYQEHILRPCIKYSVLPLDIPSKSSSKDPVPTDSKIPAPALVGKTSYETILWRMVLSASPRTLSLILCITPNSWPGPSSIILRLNDVLPTLVVTENISSGMKYFALLAFEAETSLRLRQNITINQRRREKYNQNLLREAAQQAAKEKKERLAAKKRRLKAKRAADEALAVEGAAVEKILAEFQAFTIHNPRRFLQAVVSDFLATRHRKSLFEMVEELQSFVQQLQAAEAGPRFEKVLVRFQTVAGWAQEIRVQVMRGHALTQCWIQTRRFAFQQEHSEDGLGFTVEDE
ncbi:hypothetical protein C8J56DRAFT_888886 [Mycena floridula]|nr:hypothetical protein C8J56DRAFT_888886 [Mycena floridula]